MAIDPKAVKAKRGVLAAVIGAVILVGLVLIAAYAVWIRPGALETAPQPAPVVKTEEPPPVVNPEPAPAGVPVVVPAPAPAAPGVKKAAAPVKAGPKPSPVSAAPKPGPPAAPKPAEPPPPDPAELISQGMKAYNAKQPDEALALYRRAKQAQPGNVDLGYLMGIALEQSGDLESALASFESCTSGNYAGVSRAHVKRLAKKLRKK